MARVRIIHDPVGETLTVHWKDPSADQVCEEVGDGVILIKDRHTGEVIGFERLYYRPGNGIHAVTGPEKGGWAAARAHPRMLPRQLCLAGPGADPHRVSRRFCPMA